VPALLPHGVQLDVHAGVDAAMTQWVLISHSSPPYPVSQVHVLNAVQVPWFAQQGTPGEQYFPKQK
jgi:hypothetical protein